MALQGHIWYGFLGHFFVIECIILNIQKMNEEILQSKNFISKSVPVIFSDHDCTHRLFSRNIRTLCVKSGGV